VLFCGGGFIAVRLNFQEEGEFVLIKHQKVIQCVIRDERKERKPTQKGGEGGVSKGEKTVSSFEKEKKLKIPMTLPPQAHRTSKSPGRGNVGGPDRL